LSDTSTFSLGTTRPSCRPCWPWRPSPVRLPDGGDDPVRLPSRGWGRPGRPCPLSGRARQRPHQAHHLAVEPALPPGV